MAIIGLFHVAIKTNNLDATVRFYAEVLGLRQVPRPQFGYPGAWLSCTTANREATALSFAHNCHDVCRIYLLCLD